jgi:hypothetical protein
MTIGKVKESLTSTWDLGGEPFHNMKRSLYQFQSKFHNYCQAQAAGAYACKRQPANIMKQSFSLFYIFIQIEPNPYHRIKIHTKPTTRIRNLNHKKMIIENERKSDEYVTQRSKQ